MFGFLNFRRFISILGQKVIQTALYTFIGVLCNKNRNSHYIFNFKYIHNSRLYLQLQDVSPRGFSRDHYNDYVFMQI